VPTTFLLPSFYWENFIHFGSGPKKGPDGSYLLTFPLGNEAMVWPWWEDLAERCLALIDRRATAGRWLDGDDLRAVWNAVQQSAATGQAVDLHPHQAQPG